MLKDPFRNNVPFTRSWKLGMLSQGKCAEILHSPLQICDALGFQTERESQWPYVLRVREITGKIRILKIYRVRPILKPIWNAGHLLPSVNSKMPDSTPGVCKFPCSCGDLNAETGVTDNPRTHEAHRIGYTEILKIALLRRETKYQIWFEHV